MFRDKICVIVGATGEIGRTIAERFAAGRCKIAFMDSDKVLGKQLAKTLGEVYGVETFFFHGSTSSEEDLEIFAGAVVEQYKTIDFLIHNTGINSEYLVSGHNTLEDALTLLRVSVAAPYILDKIFKGHFEKGGMEIYTVPGKKAFSKGDEMIYRIIKETVETLARLSMQTFGGSVRVKCVCADDVQEQTGAELANTICCLCEEQSLFVEDTGIEEDRYLWKMIAYPQKGWKMVPWRV